MPHFIQAQNIPMETRKPYLVSYMGQLRKALLDPSLPSRRRQKLEAQIQQLQHEIRAFQTHSGR